MKYLNYLIAFLVNACFVMHVCGMQGPVPKRHPSGKKSPDESLSDKVKRQAKNFNPNERYPNSPTRNRCVDFSQKKVPPKK